MNGALKQNYNTSDMANKIPRCIEWISGIHELEPGDVLATGTNHRGLSALQNGDTVELEIDGLGKLVVKIQDDLSRTWARETRLEREQKGPGALHAAAHREVREALGVERDRARLRRGRLGSA